MRNSLIQKQRLNLFGSDNLETVQIGDAIFRGKPSIMEEFKKLIGETKSSEIEEADVVAKKELKEEEDQKILMR